MEIDFLHKNCTFKLQINLDHHNSGLKFNYFLRFDRPNFSLPSTFKVKSSWYCRHYWLPVYLTQVENGRMIRRLRIGDADTGGKLHTSGKFSTCLNNVSSKFAASIKDNGRKQSILPLDVSVLQRTYLLYSSLCLPWMCVLYSRLCRLDKSFLQEPVLTRSFLVYNSMWCPWMCLFYRSLCCLWPCL